MIENTTARQWLALIGLGVLFLLAWLFIPSVDTPIAVLAGVLVLGGGFGLSWRLLGER